MGEEIWAVLSSGIHWEPGSTSMESLPWMRTFLIPKFKFIYPKITLCCVYSKIIKLYHEWVSGKYQTRLHAVLLHREDLERDVYTSRQDPQPLRTCSTVHLLERFRTRNPAFLCPERSCWFIPLSCVLAKLSLNCVVSCSTKWWMCLVFNFYWYSLIKW